MRKFCAALLLFTSLSVSNAVSAQTATYKIENNELVLPEQVVFMDGSSAEIKSGIPSLEHIRNYLQDKTYISLVRIEGHATTQELSEKRALTIAKWLVNHGIDCQRLLPVGLGDTKPVAHREGMTAGANTRIAVCLAALRGHLIGGMPADGGGAIAGDPCK